MGGTSAVPIGRPLPSVHGRALGEEVELFLSTFVNKVDRKGRVSVPATFRAAVADQSFPGIVVFPSFKYEALDASGIKRMEEMSARLNTLEEFSEEHENLGMLFATSHPLPVRSRGPHRPARKPRRARPHHRERGVCRAGQELPDLGARLASPSIRRRCASARAARERDCRRSAASPSGAGNDRAAVTPACTGRTGADRA